MPDFILLMHNDTQAPENSTLWDLYLGSLRQIGAFAGGSSIGGGTTMRRFADPAPLSAQLTGFIRITAKDLDEAKRLVEGNPVLEAGGTVEIRELPED